MWMWMWVWSMVVLMQLQAQCVATVVILPLLMHHFDALRHTPHSRCAIFLAAELDEQRTNAIGAKLNTGKYLQEVHFPI